MIFNNWARSEPEAMNRFEWKNNEIVIVQSHSHLNELSLDSQAAAQYAVGNLIAPNAVFR